jgi:hypothetical protein
MRLQQYILNEATDIDKLREIISDHCQPFIKEFGKVYSSSAYHSSFIYRGMRKISGEYTIKKARTDRTPRFIDDKLHKFINDLGKKLFGWNIRTEGVFTGCYSKACNFGKPYIFIPIGKYKYVYIKDTYRVYQLYDMHVAESGFLEAIEKKIQTSDDPKHEKKRDKQLSILSDIEEEIKDIYSTQYKTSGLSRMLKTDNDWEAIFKCNKYIAVSNAIQRFKIEDIMKELI